MLGTYIRCVKTHPRKGRSMQMATYDDFKRPEIRTGEIVEAEAVPGSMNLLRFVVDIGTEHRQLVAGIAKDYKP